MAAGVLSLTLEDVANLGDSVEGDKKGGSSKGGETSPRLTKQQVKAFGLRKRIQVMTDSTSGEPLKEHLFYNEYIIWSICLMKVTIKGSGTSTLNLEEDATIPQPKGALFAGMGVEMLVIAGDMLLDTKRTSQLPMHQAFDILFVLAEHFAEMAEAVMLKKLKFESFANEWLNKWQAKQLAKKAAEEAAAEDDDDEDLPDVQSESAPAMQKEKKKKKKSSTPGNLGRIDACALSRALVRSSGMPTCAALVRLPTPAPEPVPEPEPRTHRNLRVPPGGKRRIALQFKRINAARDLRAFTVESISEYLERLLLHITVEAPDGEEEGTAHGTEAVTAVDSGRPAQGTAMAGTANATPSEALEEEILKLSSEEGSFALDLAVAPGASRQPPPFKLNFLLPMLDLNRRHSSKYGRTTTWKFNSPGENFLSYFELEQPWLIHLFSKLWSAAAGRASCQSILNQDAVSNHVVRVLHRVVTVWTTTRAIERANHFSLSTVSTGSALCPVRALLAEEEDEALKNFTIDEEMQMVKEGHSLQEVEEERLRREELVAEQKARQSQAKKADEADTAETENRADDGDYTEAPDASEEGVDDEQEGGKHKARNSRKSRKEEIPGLGQMDWKLPKRPEFKKLPEPWQDKRIIPVSTMQPKQPRGPLYIKPREWPKVRHTRRTLLLMQANQASGKQAAAAPFGDREPLPVANKCLIVQESGSSLASITSSLDATTASATELKSMFGTLAGVAGTNLADYNFFAPNSPAESCKSAFRNPPGAAAAPSFANTAGDLTDELEALSALPLSARALPDLNPIPTLTLTIRTPKCTPRIKAQEPIEEPNPDASTLSDRKGGSVGRNPRDGTRPSPGRAAGGKQGTGTRKKPERGGHDRIWESLTHKGLTHNLPRPLAFIPALNAFSSPSVGWFPGDPARLAKELAEADSEQAQHILDDLMHHCFPRDPNLSATVQGVAIK
eukprot:gene28970-35995_t